MAPTTLAETQQRPVRAAVFPTVTAAEDAVRRLLAAGFAKDQITVVCSDDTKERYFREFEHQEPAGANTPAALATGSAIGATLTGAATGAIGVATGGLPFLVAAGIGIMAGAVWGGFLGAMMTRGLEKEAANFYDQEVQRGKLLLTVEDHDVARLAHAEQIFAAAGAEPMALPEG